MKIEQISIFLPQDTFYPDLEKRKGYQSEIAAPSPGQN